MQGPAYFAQLYNKRENFIVFTDRVKIIGLNFIYFTDAWKMHNGKDFWVFLALINNPN